MLLKLVNDITSIKATLKSNHTLDVLEIDDCTEGGADDDSTPPVVEALLRKKLMDVCFSGISKQLF